MPHTETIVTGPLQLAPASTERVKARFTGDFFNFFNHPADVQPNTTTGLVDLSRQVNAPRIIQFSLRLEW